MRFRMWPRWDDETESQYQRYPILGMVLAIAGTMVGLPASFCFLAAALYADAGLRFWMLGLGSFAFGLWGLWQLIFGARSRPGRLYRDKKP